MSKAEACNKWIRQSKSDECKSSAATPRKDRRLIVDVMDFKDFKLVAVDVMDFKDFKLVGRVVLDSVADSVKACDHLVAVETLKGPCLPMNIMYCNAGASRAKRGYSWRTSTLDWRSDGKIGLPLLSV